MQKQKTNHICALAVAFLIFFIPAFAYPNSLSDRLRLSFDNIPVNSNSNMGLVGVHYDFKKINSKVPDFYLGIGGYGAMTGNYGGFFTGGITAGYHKLIDIGLLPGANWAMDAGFFAGGGGGAGAFPGGGLMFRSHFILEKQFSFTTFHMGIAHTDFYNSSNPNSKDIHLTFGLSIPAYWQHDSKTAPETIKSRIAPAILYCHPIGSSTVRGSDTPQDSDIIMLGFQYQSFISEHIYTSFELYGAGSGGVDGYAKVLAGPGFTIPVIGDRVSLDSKLMVGMAGGGGVDTGGGFIIQPMLGFDINLSDNWSLKPMAGCTYAPDGNFTASTLELSLNWTGRQQIKETNGYKKFRTNYAIAHKNYFPTSSAKTKSGGEYKDRIDQLGIVISKPVNEYLNLSGSAFGAWDGGVGAYAEGLFGIELNYHGSSIAYNIGVAGGGGMDIGDGFIHQLSLGYGWQLGRNTKLSFEIGKMKPLKGGSFEAISTQITLTYLN